MKTIRSPKKNKYALIALFIILIGLVTWYTYTLTRPASIANNRFGLAFISPPDHLADEARYQGALDAGARWDRWPLYWHWVADGGYTGPHEGGRHDYDTLVIEEIEHGLTPLVILMGTPHDEARQMVESAPTAEADLPLRENPIEISTATLPPRSLNEPIFSDGTDIPAPGKAINPENAWATFVATTVERYRPGGTLARQQGWADDVGVRYWEVWNEPDFDLFWRGSVSDYYRLLEVAYKSIKSTDPDAVVLLGGLAFYEKLNWLGELLRQTGGDPDQAYFDVFSMHHYWSIYNSEARLQETRTLLDAFGLPDVSIWITESGLSVWDDYPATAHNVSPDTPWRGTVAEQSAYIIQHSSLAFYHGTERYYHFMLHDDCGDGPSTAYGLRQNFDDSACSPAEGAERPAYTAYQLAAEQFRDLIPLWRERNVEQDRVAFYRPDDQSRVLVVWNGQGVTVTTSIEATGDVAHLFWVETNEPNFLNTSEIKPNEGHYEVMLPPPTNQNAFDPMDTRYHIGGRPYIMVERDTHPPTSTIEPLPATSSPTFQVTWQGEDRGSGITHYDVWAAQGDGPLELWLEETSETQAEYVGQVDQTYHFAVRARDRAGNQEAVPAAAQATTRTVAGPTVTGIVLDPAGAPISEATVTIEGPATESSVVTQADGRWPPLALVPGEYRFSATANNFEAWPAPRTLHIEAPTVVTLTVAPADNQISSGDFEGNTVWNVWEWAGQVDQTNNAFDGQAAVRLGRGRGEMARCARGQSGQQWLLQQRVAVPDSIPPTLSFWSAINTPGADVDEANFKVTLITESGRAHALLTSDERWASGEWQFTTVDLGDWRGETVIVRFDVVRCSEQDFTITLDRVAVGAKPE
ncbi:MAG: carboxypeptidase regulatory-like domain-containing protein [Anaerolineae bacterium]|nr:carboxypeptidase regulatory-like domain-containing protein [Anaerolineae bacterium]